MKKLVAVKALFARTDQAGCVLSARTEQAGGASKYTCEIKGNHICNRILRLVNSLRTSEVVGFSMWCVLLLFSQPLLGSLFTPETRGSFFKVVEHHDLAVVNFVDYDTSKDKPEAVEEMQDAFFDLLDDDPFDDINIAFVGINLKKASKLRAAIPGLNDAMKDQETIVMLFEGGNPVEDKDGKPVTLEGPVSKRKLDNFIDKYFGEQIDTLADEADKQAAQAQQQYTYHDVQSSAQYQQPVYYEQPVYVERPVRYYSRPRRYYRGGYRRGYGRGYYGGGYRGGIGIGFGGGGSGFGGLGFGFGW